MFERLFGEIRYITNLLLLSVDTNSSQLYFLVKVFINDCDYIEYKGHLQF